ILTPEQWIPVAGSLQAIALLKQHAIKTGLVSNQSALGRKTIHPDVFQAIHDKMIQAITDFGGCLDHVAYCPHHPNDGCLCRKPLAGMIESSLAALGLSDEPQSVLMIGDSLRDVQAAVAGGITPILVQSGYGDADAILEKSQEIHPDIQIFPTLLHAVTAILGQDECL
ncbi:MAG: HAD-IIIA family hydrolase, partial [Mariprofundaceae bacterium]|nr:HAD-IIIA family hydrolase [Mariprofundaceae bacterium]